MYTTPAFLKGGIRFPFKAGVWQKKDGAIGQVLSEE